MAKKKSKGKIVGFPLDPAMLNELAALTDLPEPAEDFDPLGNWLNTYRIWTCHGYVKDGNEDHGFLRIQREPKTKDTFILKVDQTIIQNEALLHRVHATILCGLDPLAAPIRWELSSSFIGPDGNRRSALDSTEKVRVGKNRLIVETNGRSFERAGSERLTGDWCLFEAVQRLVFENRSELEFDLLEGMSLLKLGHHLSFREQNSQETNTKGFKGFRQLGNGVLPYDYWLDDKHRLVMVTTLGRAYILDPDAEEKSETIIRKERLKYRRKLDK